MIEYFFHASFIGILSLSWCMIRIFWRFILISMVGFIDIPSKITFLLLPRASKMAWTLIWVILCFRHNCSISGSYIMILIAVLFVYLTIRSTEISSEYILNWRCQYYYLNIISEAWKWRDFITSWFINLYFTSFNFIHRA